LGQQILKYFFTGHFVEFKEYHLLSKRAKQHRFADSEKHLRKEARKCSEESRYIFRAT